MKKTILVLALLGLSACSLFGGGDKKEDETPAGGGSTSQLGEFRPAPAGGFVTYIGNDGKEHKCNAPGGHCVDDNACHSSAAKCKKK